MKKILADQDVEKESLRDEKVIKHISNGPLYDSTSATESIKALVVDDNPFNIQVARALLEQKKFKVVSAFNGEQAIDVLKTEEDPFDFILMDL